MKIIRTPDGREYRFPDETSFEEIQQAIDSHMGAQAKPQTQMVDPMAESMGMFSPDSVGMNREHAPEIGATVGGIAGALTPIPGAEHFGSGVGNMVGEAIKGGGALPSSPTELDFSQHAQDFGRGAAASLAVKPIAWLASKAFGPIKQGYSMLRAGQLAEKGLPIPASAISPTEKGLALAKRARETYPGNTMVQEAHKKLKEGVDTLLGDFESKYITGAVKKDTDALFNQWAAEMGGGDTLVTLPNTMQYIQETLPKSFAKNQFWRKKAKSFLEEPTVEGVRNLWQAIKGGRDFDASARKKLLGILDDELAQYGEAVNAIRETARETKNLVSKERPLKNLIDHSYEAVDGIDTFLPDRFVRKWNEIKNTSQITERYSADEIADIDIFSQYMGVLGKELSQKPSSAGKGALLAEAIGLSGGTGALAHKFGLPTELMGLPLIRPTLSYLASRHAGQAYKPGSALYQKMLGEQGAAGEIIPGLVNIGGKLILLKGMPK